MINRAAALGAIDDATPVELRKNSSYSLPMPLYEFHCSNCGKESEVLVRSTAWEGTACPHCGSKKLAKKLSVFASGGSSAAGDGAPAPTCTGQPRSCGLCGTGKAHSH